MRLQQYLNEEYHSRIKTSYAKTTFEVFVNPSRKEFGEFKQDVRFIADLDSKNVYIYHWDGPLHEEAWEQINGTYLRNDINNGRIFAGVATKRRGKWITNQGDGESNMDNYLHDLQVRDISKYLKKIAWADKYINITEYVKTELKMVGKLSQMDI